MSQESLESNDKSIRIASGILEGRGAVFLTLARPLLDSLMQQANITRPEEFERSDLCELIKLALPEVQERLMNAAEESHPGKTRIVSHVDGVDMGSDALGYDLARRLSPSPGNEILRAFDTDISPVLLELRTFEPEMGQRNIPEISQFVFRTIVEPPNLS